MLLEFSIGSMLGGWVLPLILFFLGLGLVVFVHELGHFLAAKAVGIKVEQFAFGFGKRLFGFKIGETDYRVNLVPLGGYVKMLGQEDFKGLTENDKPDPRSYESKTVGQRFFVIAAGVIMNIILSAVLFVTVGLVGREFAAPVVGDTTVGSPAHSAVIAWDTPLPETKTRSGVATAISAAPDDAHDESRDHAHFDVPTPPPFDPWVNRFQPGDRIVAMEGNSFVLGFSEGITNLADVKMVAALARPDEKYTFTIERTVNGVTRTGRAEVGVFDHGGMLAFGLGFPESMTVAKLEAGDARIAPFQARDKIVAVTDHRGDHPVSNQGDLRRVEQNLDGRPVAVTVRRDVDMTSLPPDDTRARKTVEKDITFTVTPTLGQSRNVMFRTDGTPIYFVAADIQDGKIQFELTDGRRITVDAKDIDTSPLRILGMAPRYQVMGVTPGSNAEKAGIEPGDIVVSYGERYLPTAAGLLEVNEQHAGKAVTMEVLRDGKLVTLQVTPKRRDVGVQVGLVNGIDLDSTVVSDVLAGSAADKVGIAKGCTITAVNGQSVATWSDLVRELASAQAQGLEVELALTRRGGQSGTASIGELTPAAFHERYYAFSITPPELVFTPYLVKIQQPGIGSALVWGGKETVKMTLTSYASLRSLVAGSASVRHMAGPIGIGAMAVKAGQQGMMDFLYFLAFISSAIAVFNFLPLPVLDGGHALFLIIEKIRRKPVPVKVLNYAQYIGLALLLLIFLAVTYQDIARLIRQWFW